MKLKQRKKQNGETALELVDENELPAPMPMPPTRSYQAGRHEEPGIYLVNVAGGDVKENLVEMIELESDAKRRYGRPSLQGMLASALVREVLKETGLSENESVPYLEEQVARYVGSGAYGRGLASWKRESSDREDAKPFEVPILRYLKSAVPDSQHLLWAKTGVYVKSGKAFHGTSPMPIADVSNSGYGGSRKAA